MHSYTGYNTSASDFIYFKFLRMVCRYLFGYFPVFFSKYENSYGPYYWFAFRKNTKIPKNTKIKKF